MEEKKSFILYHDLADMIAFLTIPQRGELMTAILEYVKEGKPQVALDVPTQIVFTSVRQNLDRDREKYLEKCRINSEKGKKGGRPKKATAFSAFEEKAKKADNENENENENDNDNENGGENENENENERESRSGAATDLASRGMVPPPPPPPKENEFLLWEDLKGLGVPLSYAEERRERAEYFASIEQKSVAEVIYEWWQTDRHGTPPNKRTVTPSSYSSYSSYSSSNKTYDVDEFFEAARRRAEEEFL